MPPSATSRMVKTALDETRLLILGAQILFGFQLQAVFEDAFDELSTATRQIECVGQGLMALAIALLIAPSVHHQIAEYGEDTSGTVLRANLHAGAALLPFGLSLGLALGIVFGHLFGARAALTAGTTFSAAAAFFWYGLALIIRSQRGSRFPVPAQQQRTSLETKVEQMLTEARVIIPGAQALLGFQLIVCLSHAFESLPAASRLIHVGALCAVALSVILLMTPAALHRIAFGGENTTSFLAVGSRLTVLATVPLAVGIVGDLYVATTHASGSSAFGTATSGSILVCLLALWYIIPLLSRRR